MALKRKRVTRRRLRARRTRRFRRVARRLATRPTFVVRHLNWSSIAGNSGTPAFGQALTISLNSLPGFGELTAVWDRYTITRVKYRWYVDTDPLIVAGTKVYPRIHFAHDFTDSTTPASKAVLDEYPRKRSVFLGDSRQSTAWYSLKPAVSDSVFGGGVSTHYRPLWRPMIHTDNSSTPFYGLKTYVENLHTGVSLTLEAKVTVMLKDPR